MEGRDEARAAVVKTSFPSVSIETDTDGVTDGVLVGFADFCPCVVCLPVWHP